MHLVNAQSTGPHSISFRPGLSVPLQTSMTVTDGTHCIYASSLPCFLFVLFVNTACWNKPQKVIITITINGFQFHEIIGLFVFRDFTML